MKNALIIAGVAGIAWTLYRRSKLGHTPTTVAEFLGAADFKSLVGKLGKLGTACCDGCAGGRGGCAGNTPPIRPGTQATPVYDPVYEEGLPLPDGEMFGGNAVDRERVCA